MTVIPECMDQVSQPVSIVGSLMQSMVINTAKPLFRDH